MQSHDLQITISPDEHASHLTQNSTAANFGMDHPLCTFSHYAVPLAPKMEDIQIFCMIIELQIMHLVAVITGYHMTSEV